MRAAKSDAANRIEVSQADSEEQQASERG
jgi:hypothetical protein